MPRLPALGNFYRDNKGPTFEDHDVELARFNRWIGPSLAVSNVPDPLADPTLELHDGNGALLDSNDDWDLSPDQAEIQASGASPTNPKESAVRRGTSQASETAMTSVAQQLPDTIRLVIFG